MNGLRLSKGNSPPPCAAGRAIWIPETAPRSGPPRGPSAAREPAISGCDAASADDAADIRRLDKSGAAARPLAAVSSVASAASAEARYVHQ